MERLTLERERERERLLQGETYLRQRGCYRDSLTLEREREAVTGRDLP